MKSIHITHVLISISKDERVPAQIKSKMLQVIKYLSNESFVDTYNPQQPYRPASNRHSTHRPVSTSHTSIKGQVPTVHDTSRRTGHNQYNYKDNDHTDFIKKIHSDNDDR